MDCQDDVKYPATVKVAKSKGIVINAIQCGQNPATASQWQEIASLSQGEFFNVAQDGSAVAVATPFDDAIAKLSREMDDTRMFFGSKEEKVKAESKVKASEKLHAKATPASRARRASFNVSGSGKRNFLGENELVDAVASGRLDLDEMNEAELPEPLQALAPKDRQAVVKEQADTRSELESQIKDLAQKRDGYIAEQIEAEGGADDSLDLKLYRAVTKQAADVGSLYEAAPKY